MSSQRKKKVYCGLQEQLPDEYDRYGDRYECLRKGVGVGIHKQIDDRDEKLELIVKSILELTNKRARRGNKNN
jgi:hypothetical protein